MSEAGRLNAFGLILVFAFLVGGGVVLNVIQALVRIFEPHYTTGMPSIITLVLIYGGLMCASITMVMVADRFRRDT